MINIIALVLALLDQELEAAKVSGAPLHIVEGIQAAIDALTKVHGTPVTFGQLEGLRTKPQW